MNLLQKFHALLVSDEVQIWHFHARREGPQFCYWLTKAEPDNQDGHACVTLEELIEQAYAHIDPLKKTPPPPKSPNGQGSADCYVGKPVVIQAVQWFPGKKVEGVRDPVDGEISRHHVVTAHGTVCYLEPGDWVIREPKGDGYYPCKPNVFADRYQPIQ